MRTKHTTQTSAGETFRPTLRSLQVAGWLERLLPIPLELLIAARMATLVTTATTGTWQTVLTDGMVILALLLLKQTYHVVWGILWQKRRLTKMQDCRMMLYRHMLDGRLYTLYGARQGEMMEHIRDDFGTVTGRILDLEPSFWCAIIKTIAYFTFLARENEWIALVLTVLSAIQLLPPLIVKRFLEKNYLDCREIESELTDYTMQAYHGFATMRLYGLEDWWEKGLRAIHKRYVKIGNRSTITGTVEYTMDEFTAHLLRYGSYGILGVFVLTNVASLETALAAIALSGGFFAAVKTGADAIPSFGVADQAEERLSCWFREEQTVPAVANVVPDLGGEVAVAFDKMTLTVGTPEAGVTLFSTMSDTISLHGVTLLEGENGAGKSTILRLLLGLLQPDQGSVTVNGISPADFAPETFPKTIFYLPQEDAAWHMTPWALWEMVLGDGSLALPLAEIFGLTDVQYEETLLDALSGGERKKVFLTIAFTLAPPLLVLDEPTNSLDDKSRKVLCDLIQDYSGNILVVSHDPVVRACVQSRIILKEGKIYSTVGKEEESHG